MKKYLLHILLFFGIVVMVDICFGIACGWLQDHAIGGRMKGVRQSVLEQSADIIILGSSRAHHHYVPSVIEKVTGMSVHNCGVDGNGIVLATGLYDLMVERYTPKVVIYDLEPAFDINVYVEDGNNTRYIGWLRPYYSHPHVKEIICRVDPTESFKDFSALFRYNGKIADLLKDQVVLSDYRPDGYAPLNGVMKKEPETKRGGEKVQHDTLKLNMMEEFVAKLSKTESRLIMMASPKYGAKSSEVFDPVKVICEKYNVEFWDFYSDPEFQKMEYFKEQMHLNGTGAKAFTSCIAKRIRKTKDLK